MSKNKAVLRKKALLERKLLIQLRGLNYLADLLFIRGGEERRKLVGMVGKLVRLMKWTLGGFFLEIESKTPAYS